MHKKPGISETDYKELLNLVSDDSRVFCETQDHRSLGVFANHDYNAIVGSDVKDWNNYENSTFAELKLPVESFNQFCLLSKKDDSVVNTLLNKKNSYNVIAKPHPSSSIDLKLYQDINIIFGQKGTGKSEIINSLYEAMISKDIKCTKYIGSEKDVDFKNILNTSDMKESVDIVGASKCVEEFNSIFSWTDKTPKLFSDYIKWFSTKDNNANKSRMKITNARSIIERNPDSYEKHKTDYDSIKQSILYLEKINTNEYLKDNEAVLLDELITKLKSSIYKQFSYDIIEKHSNALVNFSIDTIKSIADRNSECMSKPSSTGFKEFVLNRINLKDNVELILQSITNRERCEYEYLGTLEDKGVLKIKKLYRMLCDKSKSAEFSLGITTLREVYSLLIDIKKKILSSDLNYSVAQLSSLCEDKSIKSSECFLGKLKLIVTEDDQLYSPSNGEKGILMLQKNLEKEADAYFLDEPELGMGNSYINNTICPQLEKLAKKHKVVVIATHNANIAVRTLPYMSVFRTHKNGVYKTYSGNPFNDKLIDIDDPTNIKSWSNESMHTLEGGKEAFYERKYIYESNN